MHQNVPQIMSFYLRYMRQESWPFGAGWSALIMRIRLVDLLTSVMFIHFPIPICFTPIEGVGCHKCLPFSCTTIRDKHCHLWASPFCPQIVQIDLKLFRQAWIFERSENDESHLVIICARKKAECHACLMNCAQLLSLVYHLDWK